MSNLTETFHKIRNYINGPEGFIIPKNRNEAKILWDDAGCALGLLGASLIGLVCVGGGITLRIFQSLNVK